MMKLKEGSALLITLLLMTGLALVCLVSWRSTIFSVECTVEKQKYEQRYQLMRGLHEYGVWFFGKHLKESLKKLELDERFSIYFHHFPKEDSEHHARLEFVPIDDKKVVGVTASLFKNQEVYGTITWQFVRSGKEKQFYMVDAVVIK